MRDEEVGTVAIDNTFWNFAVHEHIGRRWQLEWGGGQIMRLWKGYGLFQSMRVQ